METQPCIQCKDLTDEFNDDGIAICSDCAQDNCSNCLVGDCEVETHDGEYVCADCYSGMVDSACDMAYGSER